MKRKGQHLVLINTSDGVKGEEILKLLKERGLRTGGEPPKKPKGRRGRRR